MDILEQGLRTLGLEAEGMSLDRLRLYVKELERWNPRYGLVNAQGKDLIIRHILDSLSACNLLAAYHPRKVADIGSGAGLPGIPLAVMMENTRFFLAERSGKRCGFLRNVLLSLGLRNAEVKEGPFEELKGPFDALVFRGFSPLKTRLLKELKSLLVPERGLILAYKGRRSQVEEELKTLEEPLPGDYEICPVEVPFLKEERQLFIFQVKKDSFRDPVCSGA